MVPKSYKPQPIKSSNFLLSAAGLIKTCNCWRRPAVVRSMRTANMPILRNRRNKHPRIRYYLRSRTRMCILDAHVYFSMRLPANEKCTRRACKYAIVNSGYLITHVSQNGCRQHGRSYIQAYEAIAHPVFLRFELHIYKIIMGGLRLQTDQRKCIPI